MRRVYQSKLHARYRATIAIGKEHLLAEAGEASKSAHFLDDATTWCRQSFDLLLGGLLKMRNLIEQPQDVRISSVAMKERSIEAIGHEHVRTDAYRNLVIVLPMKTQAVCFCALHFRSVDLDRRRTAGKCPMACKVKASEQLKCWVVTDEDSGSGVGNLKGGFDAGHLNPNFVRQSYPSAECECPNVNINGNASRWGIDNETPGIRPNWRSYLPAITGLSNCVSYYGYEFA